jgi:A/G-specific adenine glycosylase
MDLEQDLLVFREGLMGWYESRRRDYPWRQSECTIYEVFLAEMLLRKTTAEAVDKIYPKFVSRYPTLTSVVNAEIEDISELLEPLGLQNKRAKAFKQIASECPDGLPQDRRGLLELPHVGPYIADSTLCFGYDQRQPIIDANIGRIYGRLMGNDFGSGHELYRNERLRNIARKMLPEENYQEFNWALLDFGAKVCTARSPDCDECFASSYCAYYRDV